MDLLHASPAHRPKVEPVGDRELLEQDVALRHGRLAHDAQAAVRGLDRLAPFGAVRGEILGGDPAAQCRDPLGEAIRERATVERVGAVGGDGPQGCGKVRLLQDLARPGSPL